MKPVTRCKLDGKEFNSWHEHSKHIIDSHPELDFITAFLMSGDIE